MAIRPAQIRQHQDRGYDTMTPRMEAIEIRTPFPPALHQASIYENQRTLHAGYFAVQTKLGIWREQRGGDHAADHSSFSRSRESTLER
ncbi:MAG: hypothetical protein ACR2RB_18165 [Gammaproteobacteria bacterium]